MVLQLASLCEHIGCPPNPLANDSGMTVPIFGQFVRARSEQVNTGWEWQPRSSALLTLSLGHHGWHIFSWPKGKDHTLVSPGGDIRSVAEIFNVSLGFVHNVVNLYQRFGQVTNLHATHCCGHRIITAADKDFIHSLTREWPSIYFVTNTEYCNQDKYIVTRN